MEIKIILSLMSMVSINWASMDKSDVLERLSCERYFPYQDISINGEIIFKGVGPDCSYRYDAIRSVINKYKRPFKVLDIGASNGYFSLRIAHDYPALCIMADVSDRLRDICMLNDQVPNIIYLKKELSLEDLQRLCENEHFDIVLALNVVHHMKPWKEILDVIFELGDTIIIETPPVNDDRVNENPDIPHIEQYLLNKSGGEIIARIPRAAANNFDGVITSLNTNVNLLEQKKYTTDAYAKMFCFEKIISQKNPMPCFKLSTFIALNGVFPEITSPYSFSLSQSHSSESSKTPGVPPADCL